MKLIKTKLGLYACLLIMLLSMISGLFNGYASAAAAPANGGATQKIYSTPGGIIQADASAVQVNVQISTLTGNSSPSGNAFAGDTIQQMEVIFILLIVTATKLTKSQVHLISRSLI